MPSEKTWKGEGTRQRGEKDTNDRESLRKIEMEIMTVTHVYKKKLKI